MAYSQSKKLSSSEKRLQAIKAQLYGKDAKTSHITYQAPADHKSTLSAQIPTYSDQAASTQTLVYLRQDLLKILILATLAISSEIALYFAFNNPTLTNLLR